MTSAMPETTPVTEMVVEKVARAIIDANERRERSATHGMEIVAQAAIDAYLSTRTPEAAQVERLREALEEIGALVGDGDDDYCTTAIEDEIRNVVDAALAQVRHPLEKEG